MNTATLHLRRPRTLARMLSLDALLGSGSALGDFASSDEREDLLSCSGRERMDRLEDLLALLTARQRQVLLLYVEQGPTETASLLGVGAGCVLGYVKAAMRKIRRAAAGERVSKKPDRWIPEATKGDNQEGTS